MEIHEALTNYFDGKGISQVAIAQRLGVSRAYVNSLLSGRQRFGKKQAQIWNDVFGISKAWLLTGEGEMLNDGADPTPVEVPEKEEPEEHYDRVPLLPVEAIAGPLQAISESVYPRDCKTVVSPVPGADLAIPISGDSMLPEFRPGSILFIRKLVGGFIPWGNVMVIDTVDGVYVKTVYQCDDDEDCIEAHSINPKYPPFRIPKDFIRGMYRVLGSTFVNTTY